LQTVRRATLSHSSI